MAGDNSTLDNIAENVHALAQYFVRRRRIFAPLLAIVTAAAIGVPLALLFLAPTILSWFAAPLDMSQGPLCRQPADRLHLPGRRRQRGRPSRRHHRQAADAGGDAGLSAGRLHRHGGPRLLSPWRLRSARPGAGVVDQFPRRAHGAGRLHHHAADGQDRVPDPGAHLQPQDGGIARRDAAGEVAEQEADPGALSQPHLSGRRRLWRGRRGARLFQQIGQGT